MHSSDQLSQRQPGACRYPRGRRMLRPEEFVAVRDAGTASSLRTQGHWLSMTAVWTASPHPAVRLGITISRRMARRSIDRSLVKRIVREAFRHTAGSLEQLTVRDGIALALSVRLKRAIAPTRAASRPSLTAWRALLRSDAEAAFVAVQRHLSAGDSRA